MTDFATAELMRIVSQTVMVCTVQELDPSAARAKVSFGGDAKSAWLPFTQLGSKDVRIWAPPVVGSQVVVLSPGGDTARGIIMPGPFDGAAPDDRASSVRLTMPGIDIQMDGGVLSVTLTTAEITGDLTIDGDVVCTGDVTASGISLVNHTHGGVTRGGAFTDPPS